MNEEEPKVKRVSSAEDREQKNYTYEWVHQHIKHVNGGFGGQNM